MLCADCSTDNRDEAKFCQGCGRRFGSACPGCGAPAQAGQRFCDECGSPLSAGASTDRPILVPPIPAQTEPVAERRVCSVLFADLVGFTPLSEARDPEEVRELLSRYFEVARTVIGRYGGTVEKFIGDAVMAVWGTPVSTEGDAERAVRAALDLVDSVSGLGAELGVPALAARAGVVTGEVAVTIGAAGQGMVAGDAVNTAARVQAAAEPGTVLVDTATSRLAGGAVGFADAGEHTLKGKAEPERLWRATRVLAGAGGNRVDGLEARLVGRDTELRLIKDLFHATVDRRTPRLVVVAGAPGVGKSRLGWEFRKYMDGLATWAWWHQGRCLSYGEGVAFWALAEAVRQRLQIAEEDPSDVAATKLASGVAEIIKDDAERSYISVRLGRLLGVTVAEDEGAALARDELFAGWRMFFERMGAIDPVVLLIEDAQYADAGLLDFLDHLVDWARDLPIFVLVFTRPELEERRAGFGVGRNRSVLTLDPLDATSMDALVDELVPNMPTEARHAIVSHSQGVPLFAVETVRSLIDRDVVIPMEGIYRLVGDVGQLSVPDSLHGLLSSRLDALQPSVRALVADAAVLGSSFPAEALVAISDQSEDAVRSGLAELLRREVFEVSADPLSPQRGEYRFAQQLLRQVAYDTLSRRDRKARHLAVAAHLRGTFADDGEEVADVIAQHYQDALTAVPDDPDADSIRDEAARMFVRAAERARRAGATAAAAANFATAAELAEAADAPASAQWWELAAIAGLDAAKFDDAIDYAERARALHLTAGRERAAARVQSLMGQVLRRAGRHTAAREQLTGSLEVLRENPDRDTVEALGELATLEAFAGGAEADRLTAEVLDLAQALDIDDMLLARLFSGRGVMHGIANRIPQAAAALREAIRLAGRAGATREQGRAAANLSDTLAGFDSPAAAEAARDAIELARRVGDRPMLGIAVANLVEALLGIGEWESADAALTTALSDYGMDDQDYVLVQRGRLLAMRGEIQQASAILAGLQFLRASEDPQDEASLWLFDATVADAAGDAARSLDQARRVLGNVEAVGIRSESVRWAWPLAARKAHELADVTVERELLELADRHPIGHLPPVMRAERDLVSARLQGDSDEAGPLFEAAIAALRRIPAPYHLGHALLDYAGHLMHVGQSEEAAKATREAGSIATRLNAATISARIREMSPQPA